MPSHENDLSSDFLQLARTALAGRHQDVQLLIHRASKRHKDVFPELSSGLLSLLKEAPTRASPLRKQADTPLPVDIDSRLQLLRVENSSLENDPSFSKEIGDKLNQILSERNNVQALYKLGLQPTKSVLFNGPPGVGKTLAAKWLSIKLKKPLLILDLAAVMSSYLGRTGNNIRYVLDYAKNTDCILLLDEFDAIAKRRDDSSEVGELKRLVTVLLQEIDDWPSSGLLIAATNHPKLLDPAIWRRFELLVEFSNPTKLQIEEFTSKLLDKYLDDKNIWPKILSYVLDGHSFSDIERQILLARKSSAINNTPLNIELESVVSDGMDLTHNDKIELACLLSENKIMSQRKAQELTGIARETIRKYRNSKTKLKGEENA